MDFFEEMDIAPDWEPGLPTRRYQAESIGDYGSVYAAFDEMRTVHLRDGGDAPFYVLDAVTLFVMQAKFMAGFEDECPHTVRFDQYFPTYAEMTDSQLRTYFTWRTRARYGYFEQTSLSYVFVYIYELINQVGMESPEEGLEQLFALWHGYRHYDKKIDRYLKQWIKDYWIYYIEEGSYADLINRYPEEMQDELLLYDEILRRNYEGKLELFNRISNYKFVKSKFYTGDTGRLMKDCIPLALQAADRYFSARRISLPQLLLGPKEFNVWWEPFQGAVFHRDVKMPDKRVLIGTVESYVCKDGMWAASWLKGREGRKLLGHIIKSTESALRAAAGERKKIRLDQAAVIAEYSNEPEVAKALADPEFDNLIRQTAEGCLNKARKKPVKKIVIDTSKLEAIRKAAEDIQEKLTVEEAPDETGVPSEVAFGEQITALQKTTGLTGRGENALVEATGKVEAGSSTEAAREGAVMDSSWVSFVAALSPAQKNVLQILAAGEAVKERLQSLLRQESILLEVVLEEINELSLEHLDDTILDLSDGAFAIYEDYQEETARALEV